MDRELVAVVALLVAMLCVGCGASSLQLHARASIATTAAVGVAGSIIDDARGQALDRVTASTEGQPREMRVSALTAESARWDPASASLDSTRTASIAWADSLELARLAGEDEDVLGSVGSLAARVALLYDDLARLGRALGADIPPLPDVARSLAISLGGGQ